jgi:PEP-CTERM motif-containing protein
MTLRLALVGVAATVATLAALPAMADTPLTENTGWLSDVADAADTPSEGSAWTFDISDNAVFSVVDCCIVGDIYELLSGTTLLATSTFYAGTGVQSGGAYGSYWTDSAFSKIAYSVGPGSYAFTVTGNGAGGLPAGFGVRLDSAAGVPEPATWGLMLVGFGGLGALMRGRRAALTA